MIPPIRSLQSVTSRSASCSADRAARVAADAGGEVPVRPLSSAGCRRSLRTVFRGRPDPRPGSARCQARSRWRPCGWQFGELPDLPHLAELPARGPGADLTGRTAAFLIELPVETTSTGWRFAARPGRDLSRARSLLSADLDALEETASGYQGPLKIQVCGPWTLAATIELARSQNPALADMGAVAELIESLAEGVRAHVGDVRKRVPGGQLVLQLDEPSLPTVLAGSVPTASGLNRLPAPEASSA